MIVFDHLKLVQRHPVELARLRQFLLTRGIGDADHTTIEHEADDSCCACCAREAWNDTLAVIFAAVKPPTGLIAVNLPPGV